VRFRVDAAVLMALGLGACAELKAGEETDPAAADAGEGGGDRQTEGDDAGTLPGPGDDAAAPGDGGNVGPAPACRELALGCLDPAPANVIEVPTEATLQEAFAAAKAGDVVQIKDRKLGAGWRVPAYVTLRGCEGSGIEGGIAFDGSAGTVEGFVVKGSVVANRTGSYVVRSNRFVAGGPANEAGVSGRSIDALVSASVTLLVDGNRFEARDAGVEAATRYDTMTHTVKITVRNNVFAGVARPFVASEAGLVGIVEATLEHNTFYDFDTAVSLHAVDRTTALSGNLFVKGKTGVTGSPYTLAYAMAWNVTTPAGTPPISGTFASGDPKLVDAEAGDFRLAAGSPAIDAIPNGTQVPNEDHAGCPRPASAQGALPASDIGALESQP
jgi:hypothetical protein